MPIQHLQTFVVHPRRSDPGAVQINGTTLKLDGKMFELLSSIYIKSEQDADVEITFTPASDGTQQNDCRDLICTYLSDPILNNGRLATNINEHIHELLQDQPRIDRISARAKDVDRFIKKAASQLEGRPKYTEPLNQIQDQIGARIVVFYKMDVERINVL